MPERGTYRLGTAWLHLRNLAAHGNYGDHTDTDVKQLIDGVRSFASKYPA